MAQDSPRPVHPAVRRVEHHIGHEGLCEQLGDRTSGSDLTSLLLEVAGRQAARHSPSEVLDRYERDRFTRPAAVPPALLWSLIARSASAIDHEFEFVELSPLVPLGTHSAVAGVAQNRVVTTTRATEVAADPTNSLALETAARRRALLRGEPRSGDVVRLAAVQRVVRAQAFSGPRSSAHFTLLGMVSAGRDLGNRQFEMAEVVCHLRAVVAAGRACGFGAFAIEVSDLDGSHPGVVELVRDTLAGSGVSVAHQPERSGWNYYDSLCFKVHVVHNDERVEVADGGLTQWTQRLLGNHKERLMISGLSLERFAMLAAEG